MFVLAQLSDLVWDGCSEFSQDELIDEEFDKAIDQVMQDETPLADLLPRAVKKGEDPSPVLSPTDVPTFHVDLRARRKTQLTSRLPATRRLAEQGGPPAGEQEAFEELAEWLRSRGAYINKAPWAADSPGRLAAVGLTDSDRDGQRGCVATTEIRVGELLLETRCVSGSKQGTDQQQH
eukprot:g32067.t1